MEWQNDPDSVRLDRRRLAEIERLQHFQRLVGQLFVGRRRLILPVDDLGDQPLLVAARGVLGQGGPEGEVRQAPAELGVANFLATEQSA